MTSPSPLVIGSRYVEGGGTLHWPRHRRALSRGANLVARTLLGLPAMDCTAGFRCYRREVLASIDFASIRSDGYSFLVEILDRVGRQGGTVGEIPILFEERRQGRSKIERREIYRAVHTAVRLGVERAKRTLASRWRGRVQRPSTGRPAGSGAARPRGR